MQKNVEVISLIYKSKNYLDFIINEMKGLRDSVPGWKVRTRIVANNPTVELLDYLKTKEDVRFTEYQDPHPNHWYLDKIYRAWNFAVQTSDYDNVCLINSDMSFSPGWLENLLKHHDGTNIPCSLLVESGRLVSAEPHTISKAFGQHPREFKKQEFLDFAASLTEDTVKPGGTYMPVIFERSRFLEAGGYPEGNLYHNKTQVGWKGNPGQPPDSTSGDWWFFNEVLGKKFGMKHITVTASKVFHFQEGEKSE